MALLWKFATNYWPICKVWLCANHCLLLMAANIMTLYRLMTVFQSPLTITFETRHAFSIALSVNWMSIECDNGFFFKSRHNLCLPRFPIKLIKFNQMNLTIVFIMKWCYYNLNWKIEIANESIKLSVGFETKNVGGQDRKWAKARVHSIVLQCAQRIACFALWIIYLISSPWLCNFGWKFRNIQIS